MAEGEHDLELLRAGAGGRRRRATPCVAATGPRHRAPRLGHAARILDDRRNFYVEKFTGPELAEMFGLPETTIRSRLRRAKAVIDDLVRRWDTRTGSPPSG